MRDLKRVFGILCFAILFMIPTVIIAQGDLTQTYTSPDGKFSINYPADWTLNDSDEHLTGFNGSTGFVQINFYDNNNSGYQPVTPMELLLVGVGEDELMRSTLEFNEPEELIIAGFPAVQSGSNMMGQLHTVIDFGDGVLGKIIGFSQEGQLDSLTPTVTAMMETIRYGDGPQPIVASPLDNVQVIAPSNAAGVSQLTTLGDESAAIASVAFSPDGKQLAVGTVDGNVELWNVANGESQMVLSGHSDGVTTITFGAGGYLLAVGTGSGDVRLWDATTGEGSGFMQKHTGSVDSLAFQNEGFLVASGSAEGGVQLWDIASSGEQAVLADESNPIPVGGLAFSPDGTILAVGGGGTLQLWDVATNTMQTSLETGATDISALSFSPDGSTLIYGGSGSGIWVWDLASDNHALSDGQTGSVSDLAFSPDGQVIATTDGDTVELWDASTGENKATLTGQAASIAFSPDGTLLASGGEAGGVALWGTTSDSAASQPADTSSTAADTTEAATNEETSASASSCTITAPGNANLRGGPGTEFDRAGSLSGGQSVQADGQAVGTDGMTWYRLTDGAWVRSDVVGTPAECAGLPTVSQ
ncbi:MAG: hypothetical protein LCI00_26960 [Chloroflexi bacterium]|nr:hypothetical protein [Chloroflexota bacterium]MCC6893984.1 hypothetical protein [Anaerolineae bacterium]